MFGISSVDPGRFVLVCREQQQPGIGVHAVMMVGWEGLWTVCSVEDWSARLAAMVVCGLLMDTTFGDLFFFYGFYMKVLIMHLRFFTFL